MDVFYKHVVQVDIKVPSGFVNVHTNEKGLAFKIYINFIHDNFMID